MASQQNTPATTPDASGKVPESVFTRFAKPQAIDAVRTVFPAGVMRDLLPPMADIPNEFKVHGSCSWAGKTTYTGAKWIRVVSDWFFTGLHDAQWVPKAGIDTATAVRHLSACMGSFEPKHEHKEAGCAFLMSLWFDDVTYTARKAVQS